MLHVKSKYLLFSLIALPFIFGSCIKNDIPYPRIAQKILAIAAEGESKSAYIDSISFEVNVYLEETTDIENVRFTEYKISEGGESSPDLLDGTYDMSSPLFVTISRFQDYTWEIKANQEIERYFEVQGQIGESVIDPAAQRVIVNVPEGTDLSRLVLERVKLGPAGITTIDPDIRPGVIDLSYPMRVNVSCHGRTKIWTIYAEFTETIVNTTQVDAWSQVVWAYGSGPADADNGFEYRKTSDSPDSWTRVDAKYVTSSQGNFSCYIPHLEPLTEYIVRTYSGEEVGNEVRVTTQATADIPDGDFEQWCQQSFGNGLMWCPWDENGEQYWDTGNKGSMTVGENLTVPTDHTPTGSGRAAMCQSKAVGIPGLYVKLGAGSIFTGEYMKTVGTNGVLGFGRSWNLRPTVLKGYFQYQAKDISEVSREFESMKGQPDTCHIYVALTDWTAPYEIRTSSTNRQLFNKDAEYVIAYGELTYSGVMNSYQVFSIKLNYKDTSRVPSYLQITGAASKYGDYFTGGAGSTLYLDQLSFDYDLE